MIAHKFLRYWKPIAAAVCIACALVVVMGTDVVSRVHAFLSGGSSAYAADDIIGKSGKDPGIVEPQGFDRMATEIRRMQRQMDRMFRDSFASLGREKDVDIAAMFRPDADIRDAGDRYSVQMDVPGYDKSTIEVSLDGQELRVSGKREESQRTEKESQYVMQERRVGSFSRIFNLPGPVQETGVKAKLENGVLTIDVLKDKNAKAAGSKIVVE